MTTRLTSEHLVFRPTYTRPSRAVLHLLWCLPCLVGCFPSTGTEQQQNAEQDVIRNDSVIDAEEEDLQMAEIKSTYLDNQTKPIPTVIAATKGFRASQNDFRGVQDSKYNYTNDIPIDNSLQFEVKPKELAALLRAVKPIAIAPENKSRPNYISFDIIEKKDGHIVGYEYKVDRRSAERYYRARLKALGDDNNDGQRALSYQFDGVVPPDDRHLP